MGILLMVYGTMTKGPLPSCFVDGDRMLRLLVAFRAIGIDNLRDLQISTKRRKAMLFYLSIFNS